MTRKFKELERRHFKIQIITLIVVIGVLVLCYGLLAHKKIHAAFYAIDGETYHSHQVEKIGESALASLDDARHSLTIPVDDLKNGVTIFIATKDGDTLLHIVAMKEFSLSGESIHFLRTLK